MARRVRVGVIGAGSWVVASHLPNLVRRRNAGEIELAIVSRRDPVALERIREGFGFARATTDWQEVVAAEPDVVVVATPPSLHYAQARAALEHGAHVLCEKPFTLEPADAWNLAATAEQTGRTLVVAHGWNFRPIATEAHRLAREEGAIGDVEHVAMHMHSFTRALLSGSGGYAMAAAGFPPNAETWTSPELSGGGYGQAQLTHLLGLGLWLTDLRAASVFALMKGPPDGRPDREPTVELHDAVCVRYTNGAIGTVSGASGHKGSPGDRQSLTVSVVGSAGSLQVDVREDILWLQTSAGRSERVPLPSGAGLYDCRGPVDAVVDAALGRPVRNDAPAELGARTVEVLEAAYRSAVSGRLEHVELEAGHREAHLAP